VSQTVQTLVDNDVSMQDAIERGYGNYSAIARILKPQVEEALGHATRIESIITAVKRVKSTLHAGQESIAGIVSKSVINLRTDVAKISIEKTRRSAQTVRRTMADLRGEFLQILEGVSAITLVFDETLFDSVCSMFRRGDILDEKKGLAAIMVHSPRAIIGVPGSAVAFYNPVSRRHINIEETMSCFTDTILVVRMEDVGRAFSSLTEMISQARRTTRTRPGRIMRHPRRRRR
jgi:hypothetical protein